MAPSLLCEGFVTWAPIFEKS